MARPNQNKNHSKPAPQAPAAVVPEQSKGLFARAAEAIDHAIHPDAQPKSEPEMVQPDAGVMKVGDAEIPVSSIEVESVEGEHPELTETVSVNVPAKTYREHQDQWLSKKERMASEDGSVRGKVYEHAERCPTEEADLAQQPKFSKFKKGVN